MTLSAATGPGGKRAQFRPTSRTCSPRRSTASESRLPRRPGKYSVPATPTVPFSIQSISKVFTLAMALSADDSGTLWSRVLREPSGTSFNSLVQLEVEHGIPRNPFINSGALVVTDHLMESSPDAAAQVLRFLTGQAGQTGSFHR